MKNSINNIKMKIFDAYIPYSDQFHEYYQRKYNEEMDKYIQKHYDGLLEVDAMKMKKILQRYVVKIFNANVDKEILSKFGITTKLRVKKISESFGPKYKQASDEIFEIALHHKPTEIYDLMNDYLTTNYKFDDELMEIIQEFQN